MSYPFEEKKIESNVYIRKFSKDLESNELKWHKDKENRTIVPLEPNDWFFQRDNKLPEPMDGEINIKANEWHRVIKGKSDLIIKVIKHEN